MMITALEPLTKSKMKVYIDEEFAFVLTTTELEALELKENSLVSETLYMHITTELLLKKAKLKAMNLLKVRDYTEEELRNKLKADFYPPLLIDEAVAYVKSYNYINDRRYIENFCRLNAETMSRQMLIFKLRQKGLSNDLISEYTRGLFVDEQTQIIALVRSRCKPDDLKDSKKRQKILNFLLRKGYSYGEIRSALKDLDS